MEKSAAGTTQSIRILKTACSGTQSLCRLPAFLEMNSKTDGRALMRDHEAIYIFHNVIDNIGDDPRNRSENL